MGMRPTHDPYGGLNPLVDKLIGVPAYEVVRRVACNLDYIRAVGCNIERVFQVSENLDEIEKLLTISEDISQLALHADEIALIAAQYPEIQEVYEKIPELLEVNIEIEKAYQASTRSIDAADRAEQARDDAIAAAEATGNIVFVDTYADAVALLPLPDETVFEVSQDETRDGSRTRYVVENGALEFKTNFDQTRIDLADPTKGAGMVAWRDPVAPTFMKTVSDIKNGDPINLFRAIPKTEYSAIQAGTSTFDSGEVINRIIYEDGVRHLQIPWGIFTVEEMVELNGARTIELLGGAELRRRSDSALDYPVVWVKGNRGALIGTGMTSIIRSQKRVPKGACLVGHWSMAESHGNVNYNNIGGVCFMGPKAYGQTDGNPDYALLIQNPQFGGMTVYFQQMYNLFFAEANFGLGLRGWANGNTIDNLHFYRLGSRLVNGGAAIHDHGSLDNSVSGAFFHASPNSIGILFEDLDNTANGGIVHRTTDSSYRGIICEQGGASAQAINAINSSINACYIEVKDNVAGGAAITADFYNKNTFIRRGSYEAAIISRSRSRASRIGNDAETTTRQPVKEYYLHLTGMAENTQQKLVELTIPGGSGLLVQIDYATGFGITGLAWQTAGSVTYAIRRAGAAAPTADAIKYNRMPGGGGHMLTPLITGNAVSLCHSVPNNGTGTTSYNVNAKVTVIGGITESMIKVFSDGTREIVSGLAPLTSPISV